MTQDQGWEGGKGTGEMLDGKGTGEMLGWEEGENNNFGSHSDMVT